MIRNPIVTKENDFDWPAMRLLHFVSLCEQKRKRIVPEYQDEETVRIPALGAIK